jgi:biopolymer transport protein ExbD
MIKKKKVRDVEIPSSSMADIAFLLLVFFLLTTTIDMQKGLNNVLPPSDSDDVKIPKKNIANILVNEHGNVLLSGEIVEVNDIRDIISRKINENPQLVVSLKTHKDTKYDIFIRVYDQLKLANAKKISIADPDPI